MTRLDLTENMRRLRHAADRSPIDNAFFAFMALSEDDKAAMIARFNDVEGKRAHPRHLRMEAGASA